MAIAAVLVAGSAAAAPQGSSAPTGLHAPPDAVQALSADGLLLGGNAKGALPDPGGLVVLDPITFEGKLLGDHVTAGGITGLVATPDQKVWASVRTGATFHATDLVRLYPYSGAVLQQVPITDGGQDVRVSELALEPGTNRVFGLGHVQGALPHSLYTIDTVTGNATLVGLTGLSAGNGLAFATDGTLYALSGGASPVLVTLDPATGSVLTTLSCGPDNFLHGLTVRPSDGALLATRGQSGGGDRVIEIDPVTGATTQLGSSLVGNPGDLAFLPLVQPTFELLGGIAAGSPLNPGGLARVDESTWSGTLLGDNVPFGGLTGLAATPDDRLFATATLPSGGLNTSLLELAPDTGAVLTQMTITSAGAGGVQLTDLAVQPGTGTVFGFGRDITGLFKLFTVDTTTAIATVVGQPAAQGSGGLAFAPDGTLYYVQSNTDKLYTLDPATGASGTPITYGPATRLHGLAVRPSDGVLLATRGGQAGGDQVVRIDVATGLTTNLGALGVGNASDLAFRPLPGFAPPATLRFATPANPGQIEPFLQDRMVLGASPTGTPAPDAVFTVPNPGTTLVIVWYFAIAPFDLFIGGPGTLLVSPAPPTAHVVTGLFASGDSLSVGAMPSSPELLGLPVFSQGAFVETNGGVYLTNAIDYVIGNY